MADHIQKDGWSLQNLWPRAQGMGGQVAILSALYAIFGVDPALMLPINAVLHATSGIMMFLIAQLLYPGRTGRIAGVAAAVLFVVFPSSLNWYAQVHKDGFAITGTLLIMYAWLRFYLAHDGTKSVMYFVAGSILGVLLIVFVRPYNTIFLVVASAAWICFALIIAMIRSEWRLMGRYFISSFLVWILFTGVAVLGVKHEPNNYEEWAGKEYAEKVGGIPEICENWEWQSGSVLPAFLEKYAEMAARTRAGLICSNYDAASTIDRSRLPRNVTDIILYMPRTFALALFAPFPDMWFNPPSLTRIIGAFELCVWYLLVPGVFLALRERGSNGLMLCIGFALTYLAIYGFTIGNLGTLHRVRYPFLMFFMMVGIIGWLRMLDRRGFVDWCMRSLNQRGSLTLSETFEGEKTGKERKQVVGLGIYVSILTLLAFIGFFYRDVLMAQIFGLGSELDAFFVALLIPMTIVTIICIPLGAAFTPHFLEATESSNRERVRKLISSLSATSLIALFLLCVTLFIVAKYLLPYVTLSNRDADFGRVHELVVLALPILLFSGPVIVGNAVLNALGKVVRTGLAQLVVPIIAILSILVFSRGHGVEAAMVGMVIGQLLNLFILEFNLRLHGFTLLPLYNAACAASLRSLASQYFPLIASAFFVSVALLVNTLLAMSFPDGGASVFNLGNKIVMLMTGLISAAISTVMLPYFSAMIAKNHVVAARRELSIFLLLLTFVTVPVCVVLFVYSQQIVELIFEGGSFDANDVGPVSRVMRYAVVQIPFFCL